MRNHTQNNKFMLSESRITNLLRISSQWVKFKIWLKNEEGSYCTRQTVFVIRDEIDGSAIIYTNKNLPLLNCEVPHSSVVRVLSVSGNRDAQRPRFKSWWGSFFDQLNYIAFFFQTLAIFFRVGVTCTTGKHDVSV